MRTDENGYVCVSGATDSEDSSMFVGVLATFCFNVRIDLNYINSDGKYQRCKNPKYDFSRDQFICFIAGLKTQGFEYLVDRSRVTGKDLMSPSVQGHIRRCKGLRAYFWQDLWLWLDVMFNCWVKPLAEPNQLVCMMMVHPDKKYLRFWTKNNKQWIDATNGYWNGWRNEPTVSAQMIKKIIESV